MGSNTQLPAVGLCDEWGRERLKVVLNHTEKKRTRTDLKVLEPGKEKTMRVTLKLCKDSSGLKTGKAEVEGVRPAVKMDKTMKQAKCLPMKQSNRWT